MIPIEHGMGIEALSAVSKRSIRVLRTSADSSANQIERFLEN